MQYHVIWNGGSGKSLQIEQLRRLLVDVPTRWTEMQRDVDLHQCIAASECQTVIAAGGDGTVNAVVNAMMKIDIASRPNLAVIPLGTANDFAGTLGISDEINLAVAEMRHSEPIRMDVVKVFAENYQRWFANVAAGGNCVRVSEEMTDEIKQRWGALSYVRGAISVLADMNSYRVRIDIDGDQIEMDSWAILIANGRTNAGRIEVAPLASTDDGLLDVVLIKDGNVMDMVEIVAGNLSGSFEQCDQVIYRQAKCVELQSSPPMRFTMDGEIVDEEPIRFCIEPAAIAMYVGRDGSIRRDGD
ncbi:diacylglycerol/lipid kinase family protein [Neorhodopirellula pilleata]|uniref:Diacylglycerol kinase n=1 Tax=Neorhodopirellula pilleata TaxID=2714738 RepID=A0A5C6ASF3_9BACT|nr:diacylglycerol kinase family protein [Neorhodopirellula pilleata]TWU02006.1 Diacylglycerol kinase [Neorhodopirellula pilleata]